MVAPTQEPPRASTRRRATPCGRGPTRPRRERRRLRDHARLALLADRTRSTCRAPLGDETRSRRRLRRRCFTTSSPRPSSGTTGRRRRSTRGSWSCSTRPPTRRCRSSRSGQSTITGAGIQLVTVWQSKAQLDQAYGKDADNVLTNHRTKLIFPSGLSDLSTIEYISALVGDEHVRSELDERTGTSGDGRPPDRSPSTAVPFLSPSTLRRVRVGDAFSFTAHCRPRGCELFASRQRMAAPEEPFGSPVPDLGQALELRSPLFLAKHQQADAEVLLPRAVISGVVSRRPCRAMRYTIMSPIQCPWDDGREGDHPPLGSSQQLAHSHQPQEVSGCVRFVL